MFNLLQLQQQRATKAYQAKDLVDRAEKDAAGPRPMTPDEISLFDRLEAEIKALDAQISSVLEHQRRQERSAALVEELGQSQGRQTAPDQPAPSSPASPSNFKVPATARRTRVLKAFKPRHGETPHDVERRAYRAGMWARAYVFKDQRAVHWCLHNAMGTVSNPDGGFLIPDEFSDTIIDLREMYGVFRRETRVVPMGRDTLLVPRRLSGVTIGPVGENPSSAISQSNPTFNQVQLTAKKAGGLCLMSTEVAEDAVIDLADWIAEEFAYGFAKFEDQCGFVGDGTSTYMGIRGLTNLLTEASGLAGAVLATATHDTFAEVDASDLAKLMAALPEYAADGAKFYCSRAAAELVFGRLQATAGGNAINNLTGERVARGYLGYEIVVSQVLPSSQSTITDGTPMLFFGDLSRSSTMGDRREVRVFPSEHRYMDTDQIGIRGTERIDIVNHDLGDSTTAGPIVALIANAS